MPTLEQYLRHARQFGTESVYETAEAARLPACDLLRLRIELDTIDAERKSRSGLTIGKRRKRTADETRDAVSALTAEGLVPTAIGFKLGLSNRSVRRYRREVA